MTSGRETSTSIRWRRARRSRPTSAGGVVRDNLAVNELVSKMTALGRPGLPEDLGQMIACLLSGANHWVNAQRIEVSGGMRL
jgi:NAD(P)-dependent dehydrogenase (short-subunit alcohol dehydrogenase family)